MKSMKFIFLIVLGMLLSGLGLMANDIAISNLSHTGKNTTDHFTLVKFDITWGNSWRTTSSPGNWDAAWVFVKYRVGGGDWQHAWLNESGHTAPAGSTIMPGLRTPGTAFNATTNPGLGAFLYRSVDGTGTFTNTGVQLRWNYGANGLTDADADVVEIRAFAIEMVYVLQGNFTVGSSGNESGSFTNGSWTSGPTIALSISSENALNIANSAGNLWGTSGYGVNTIGSAGTLPAAYPKGFTAFYSMKYEISQQQYVDFLNTLTQTQADNRKYTGTSARYAITGSTVGSYATAHPYVACNYLSWMDGAAYLDWSGLRPMTELEFEKACRGTVAPVANEYAWGTETVAGSAYTLSNSGQTDEGIASNYSIVTNTGNASYQETDGSIDGPLRVGIFAGHTSNTGRITAGASYYGIMELSGNLWERTVTVGNDDGRAYTGVHGNGVLSPDGYANETAWPGFSSDKVTGANGSGLRGGSFTNKPGDLRASDRFNAVNADGGRFSDGGFRGVRMQPLPKLTTTEATGITSNSAISGGNVTSDGGGTITARGVCWSTTTGPTADLPTTTIETGTTDLFTSNLINLAASTRYYVRAYATNSAGTAYGNEVSFTTAAFVCGTSTVSDIDNNTYTTVLIGTQCWMKENLKVTKDPAGNDITRYCNPNVPDYCDTYGGLYDWSEMMNGASSSNTSPSGVQGICPTGWHIPGNDEWSALATYVSSKSAYLCNSNTDYIGKALAAKTNWNSANCTCCVGNDLNANNATNFTGLPGGYRRADGLFNYLGDYGYFWSSTEDSPTIAWGRGIDYDFAGNYPLVGNKSNGCSVRCLKNSYLPTVTTTAATSITSSTATSGGIVTDAGEYQVTARGVCWSTTTGPTADLPTTTTETGTTGEFISNLTGLNASTQYYVRAYATNSADTAYGNEVSFTTEAPFVCGTSTITINHLASGGVAPVDKSVSYGTVSTTLFGGTKCAITQNLGADHQATAVSDATEASAGWYWQFNRKQGYKADCANGSTCYIPSSPTWDLTFDNLSTTWEAAKDPCTLELGSGWRIPTNTEWTSADGSWTNWNDTWASSLKIHATGYLHSNNGSLNERGTNGYYWGSTQSSSNYVRCLSFSSSNSMIDALYKTNGLPVRCIKDLSPTLTTTDASVITATTATSGGNITTQNASSVTARGICWSTTSNPTTSLATKTIDGTGTGPFTSAITGLLPSTLYHIRAYATNTEGTSYGEDKTFTTTAFVCGTSALTANHYVANGVAPVDKSVSYGTVSTTLFGGTKCAITQNLGATNRASSATDDTEASAGWYWQFNRKQGYKHTGATLTTVLTPSWTITGISETSDWIAANDPCALELGTGWRIPTSTEWTNADGSWSNITEAWNSDLKLHAGGFLLNSDGALSKRGSTGYYWSSTQDDASSGRNLLFDATRSIMKPTFKATGLTARCLKD